MPKNSAALSWQSNSLPIKNGAGRTADNFKLKKSTDMTIISKSRLIELAGYALALSSLLLTACGEAKEQDLDKLCGNWVSVGRKPDVLVFKEGEQYKVTVFNKSGVSRKLKPQTFLIVEESGNLFINTGYRIDIAYNEETDVLTFSPNGDYTRASEKQ